MARKEKIPMELFFYCIWISVSITMVLESPMKIWQKPLLQ